MNNKNFVFDDTDLNSLEEGAMINQEIAEQGYGTLICSFEYNGTTIVNPFMDETGRFEVNPFEYYGVESIRKFIDAFTEWNKKNL